MSNDFIEPWQKMMTEWQKTQTSVAQQMMDNMQKWNRNFEQPDNSYYSNNPILDIYQSFIQKFFDHNPQYNLESSTNWQDVFTAFPGSESLIQQTNDIIKGSSEVFDKVRNDFIDTLPDDSTKDYFLRAFDDISNPYAWLKLTNTDFNDGLKRFSEGPLFSGISDVDNRIAKAMDGWLELGEKTNDYYEILLQNWIKAYEDFLNNVKGIDSTEEPLSPRKLIELWSSVANENLMVMHRSDEFLEAQKQLIKATAAYRLYEQDIAEIICTTLHIPTRKEVDDLHQTITELRREVRELKKAKKKAPNKSKTTTAGK